MAVAAAAAVAGYGDDKSVGGFRNKALVRHSGSPHLLWPPNEFDWCPDCCRPHWMIALP